MNKQFDTDMIEDKKYKDLSDKAARLFWDLYTEVPIVSVGVLEKDKIVEKFGAAYEELKKSELVVFDESHKLYYIPMFFDANHIHYNVKKGKKPPKHFDSMRKHKDSVISILLNKKLELVGQSYESLKEVLQNFRDKNPHITAGWKEIAIANQKPESWINEAE